MRAVSANAGTDAGRDWARGLAPSVFALALAACGSMSPDARPDRPPEAQRQIDPANKDALDAPANESPANPAPSEPQPVEPAPPPPDQPAPAPDEPPPPPTIIPEPMPPPQPTPELPDPNTPIVEAPPPEPSATDKALLKTRKSVRETTEWLAHGVDSWFGDQPFDESGGEVRDGRLSVGFFKRQDERLDTRVRFNVRLRLPNAERRAYLFVGRDNEREVVSDTPGVFSRQDRLLAESREERSFFTGLGLSLREAFDLRIGFHGFKPYAQARYRQPWTLSDSDLVEFRQTFFYRISDRFGSTTVLSYEHALSRTFALRWITAGTITQKSERFDWSSIVGGYKSFSHERLLSLEWISTGQLASGVPIGEYGAQVKWLQPIYRDWLLGELLVGYFWPRADRYTPRARRWALGYVTTMRF